MTLDQLRHPWHSDADSVQNINARVARMRPDSFFIDFKYWSKLAAYFGGTYVKGLKKFECHWEYNPQTGELKTAQIRIDDYITKDSVIKKPGMQYYTGMTKESVKVKGL